MSQHSRTLRTSGAVIAATTAFGLLAPSVQAATHTVASGDTLWAISRQYGTTVNAIAAANGISTSTLLMPGQQLVISGEPANSGATGNEAAAPVATSAPSAAQHVVAPGETLSSIASIYGTSFANLASINGLADPNRIYVGQVLSVSGSAGTTESVTYVEEPAAPVVGNSVGANFLHYTYDAETVYSANVNKDALMRGDIPSTAEMQSIIASTAVEMGVNPALALAHAQVESHFDQSAVSPANAVGAMQVLPSTAEWIGGIIGRNLDVLNPYENAIAGIAYIRYIQANASSMDEGIAAYYQGLGGVQLYGMLPDTVNYVYKVRSAMANY
ncbi:MAG: LysM peptidoglycan-binding domain-containing protein [Ancrocorticia sp.]